MRSNNKKILKAISLLSANREVEVAGINSAEEKNSNQWENGHMHSVPVDTGTDLKLTQFLKNRGNCIFWAT